ncbi:MAG: tetratricopeptide repeat protein [Planctomycetota bacterium]|jgi:tetratricopeptide (TPR) repeat protein
MNHIERDDKSSRDQKGLIDFAWQQVEQASPDDTDTTQGADTRVRADLRRFVTIDPPEELPGYKLEREIHRGGQGVVYLGIQNSTGRRVAIKFMLGGVFSGTHERVRFEREIQILARLRHPNIVTIHDSGTSENVGYFVMDYIEGRQLDEYVEHANLPFRQRLALFQKICAAVNTAHLHGVIHRDLKPGNIRIDKNGEPHILDFGLAKMDDPMEEAGQGMTMTGQFVGSLPWASPEQAESRHDEIDLRTDVYALGVILYQLLTGTFPYDLGGSIAETARRIANTEPKDPRSINGKIDDEIATIVLKALRKDPPSRYQTAGGFGMDIGRYLAGEPIEAKAESITYVLRKQLVRHKVAVAMTTLVFLLILVGLGVSLAFWREAVLARDAESEQRHLAQRNADLAERRAAEATSEAEKGRVVTEFLTEMISSASPMLGGKPDITVREVVETTEARIDGGSLADQPDIEAAIRHVLGKTYGGLGLYEESEVQMQLACELLALHPENPDYILCKLELSQVFRVMGRNDVAEEQATEALELSRTGMGEGSVLTGKCLDVMGDLAGDKAELDAAEQYFREAIDIYRKADVDDKEPLAGALNDLALILEKKGDLSGALDTHTEALTLFREKHGVNHYASAITTSNLASLNATLGNYDVAEQLYQEAIGAFVNTVGEEHPYTASSLGSMGRFYIKQGRTQESLPYIQQCLAIRRKVFGNDHTLIANSLNNLALAQYQLGEIDGALMNFEEAKDIFVKTRGADHPSISALINNIGAVYRVKGDLERSAEMVAEALRIERTHLGEDHHRCAKTYHNLSTILLELRRLDEAESAVRSALKIRKKLFARNHPDIAKSMDLLAGVLRAQGELEEAESLGRAALKMFNDVHGPENQLVAGASSTLAQILMESGELTEAEELARESVLTSEKTMPAGHWQSAVQRGVWGKSLYLLGRYQEAERELLKSHELLVESLGDDHFRTISVVELLVELYESTNRPSDTETWKTKLPQPSEP